MGLSCANPLVLSWIESVRAEVQPDAVRWIDGSEFTSICQELVAAGQMLTLNQQLYPNCYLARSHPSDVARVEDRTFICSRKEEDSGPTNHWAEPAAMYQKLRDLMRGCMRGRTMYVVPYLMGPPASPFSKVGFELTDSLYVAANMCVMARVGQVALDNLPKDSAKFIKGIHSVGNLDEKNRYICHFPEDNTIISYNSNYGGNALQGKKCFALRIASRLGRDEGWLAEHMLILGITNPAGEKKYIVAAFPSACGKTNLAMLQPPPEYAALGWKVETVGDDIAWLRFGSDGRLYASNPEAGFFGVAPSTSEKTNPNALATIKKNTIFTNVALNPADNTPWWDGLTDTPPARLIDWQGREWTPQSTEKPAHPNSRFTAPAVQCPSMDQAWDDPRGVPVSAIVFGGRRATTAPLVFQTNDWNAGVYTGLTMGSERTAAAEGKVGELRRDPFAMLPFIGYHIGDYVAHWGAMQHTPGAKLPPIFHVNWFRRDTDRKFLWPGYSQNIRVLEWILRRAAGEDVGEKSPLGVVPKLSEISTDGLGISQQQLVAALAISKDEWAVELGSQKAFFDSLGEKVPQFVYRELEKVAANFGLVLP